MVTINGNVELLSATVNEAYKENGEVWDKVLIIRFPKSDYPFEQAKEFAETANKVFCMTKDKSYDYTVDGIIEEKENKFYSEFWLNNPDVAVTESLAQKIEEQQAVIESSATEEEINEAIAEGVNSID